MSHSLQRPIHYHSPHPPLLSYPRKLSLSHLWEVYQRDLAFLVHHEVELVEVTVHQSV
jgi:hypothetical protein